MKVRLFLTVLAVLSFITYSRSTCAQEQTSKNFYYPTGSINFRISTRWLAADCDGSGEYITIDGDQKYHVGTDIIPNDRDQVVGSPVYAISDGLVVYRSDKPTSGWGEGNIALVIKHELSNGQPFFAVYGHIRSNLNEGKFVDAGQSFATIGPLFDEKGTPIHHLHFGINLGLVNPLTGEPVEPRTNLGIMSCSNWPDTNGFVEPITWIETQKSPSTVNPLGQQAKQELVNREKTALILGSWKDEDSVIEYLKDGTFISNADTGEKYAGTWNINGDTLTLRYETYQNDKYLYKILELSTSAYKIVGISGDKRTYNARRIKPSKQSPVYATKNSRTYHRRNCSELNTEDLIEFTSPQKAREAGGIPCKHCNPSAIVETTKKQDRTRKPRTTYKWLGLESLFKDKKEIPTSSRKPAEFKSREMEVQVREEASKRIDGFEKAGIWSITQKTYCPLEEGRIWVYQLHATSSLGREGNVLITHKTFDQRKLQGRKVIPIKISGGGKTMFSFLAQDDKGVYEFAAQEPTDLEPVVKSFPLYSFQEPIRVGTTWNEQRQMALLHAKTAFQSAPPKQLLHLTITATIESLDDVVTVPAGTFNNCLKVSKIGSSIKKSIVGLYLSKSMEIVEIKAEDYVWYAPGVGLVRQFSKEESNYYAGGQISYQLESFEK